ncbi:MAG: pectate lyase [Planctomycetota bacterium]|nr:pectate lyase [Planctomycetota bacterium]
MSVLYLSVLVGTFFKRELRWSHQGLFCILAFSMVFEGPVRLSQVGAQGPLEIDPATGQYRDLSYEALSMEGLSWEERTRLFGGETIHYENLGPVQRRTASRQLAELRKRLDRELAARCEKEVRDWLDRQVPDLPRQYTGRDINKVRAGAVLFFRAFEMLQEKRYLEAGLKRADLVLESQWPRGHWPWPGKSENFVRIQDGSTTEPFWIMLYAHKVSGEKKYLDSARRCADLLLSLQRPGGGWGDQWSFNGTASGNTGVYHGISFNDRATNAPYCILLMMHHLTGEKKYIANLGKLWPWILKANLGENDQVAGWGDQYNDDGTPARARRYEIELPSTYALTRAVGPLLIWNYMMTGEEQQMDLLRKAYAWHEQMRKTDLKPENWKLLLKLNDHQTSKGHFYNHYRPGWPSAYLPDGSNWGGVTGYNLFGWYGVDSARKEKYGRFLPIQSHEVTRREAGRETRTRMEISAKQGWLKIYAADDNYFGRHQCHCSMGNDLSQIRRALLEHKRGGRKAMLKYHSQPTRYSPDQYLQARLDAARRALSERNRRLAGDPHGKGLSAIGDPSGLLNQKGRWYGDRYREVKGAGWPTKWGAAYYEYLQNDSIYDGKNGNVAWYQWQLLYDTLLADGKIDAQAAARGGRGTQGMAMQTCLDSWDVLGEWKMACHELEDFFQVSLDDGTSRKDGE